MAHGDADKHEIFCQSVARGRNLNEAYTDAGYVPHKQNAWRLYQRKHIQDRIGALREKIVVSVTADKGWVMRKLVETYERAAKGEEQFDARGRPKGQIKYDHGATLKALELIGKSLGMFIDRRETGRPGDFSSMDSKTIEQQLYDEYRGLGLSDDKARALASAASSFAPSEGEGGAGGQPN